MYVFIFLFIYLCLFIYLFGLCMYLFIYLCVFIYLFIYMFSLSFTLLPALHNGTALLSDWLSALSLSDAVSNQSARQAIQTASRHVVSPGARTVR